MVDRRLKVMWDYSAFPVWYLEGGAMLDKHDLPISEVLRQELQAWSDDVTDGYWGEFGPDDPRTAEPSRQTLRDWDTVGRKLASRLQEGLGVQYEVLYWSEETGELELNR